MQTEIYFTLSFNTNSTAQKHRTEIEGYFKERIQESEVIYGIDERGKAGFQVSYTLTTKNN